MTAGGIAAVPMPAAAGIAFGFAVRAVGLSVGLLIALAGLVVVTALAATSSRRPAVTLQRPPGRPDASAGPVDHHLTPREARP